ncbi:hypothetical protein I6E29_03155 [Arcanobacterium haemolyticum]|nr:hypothetical protein [Arcanobacterium haemolyticum]
MILSLAAFLCVLAGTRFIPQPWWTAIHLLTLGVLTNAILQWSWFFARSLLHLPPDDKRAGHDQIIRIVVFNALFVVLIGSMWAQKLPGVLIGSLGIATIISWHGAALIFAARSTLASRFAVVIRFYIAASFFLVVGCALAACIASSMLGIEAFIPWRDGLTLAHALANVGGWIGLSIAGTVITLGPTILHSRMSDAAVPHAIRTLPFLVLALSISLVCALFGWMLASGIALGVYAILLAVSIGGPFSTAIFRRMPSGYASWALLSGCMWAFVGIIALALELASMPSPASVRTIHTQALAVLGVGGVAQIFVASLSHLMPVVIGRGPGPLKVGIAVLNTAAGYRLTLRNLSLLCALVTGMKIWWAIVALTYGADIVLFASAGIRQVRASRKTTEGHHD